MMHANAEKQKKNGCRTATNCFQLFVWKLSFQGHKKDQEKSDNEIRQALHQAYQSLATQSADDSRTGILP